MKYLQIQKSGFLYFLCMVVCVAAYTPYQSPNQIAKTTRYPVGYDPDNRNRPDINKITQESQQNKCEQCTMPLVYVSAQNTAKHPRKCKTHFTQRSSSRWVPPVGYDPRLRNSKPNTHYCNFDAGHFKRDDIDQTAQIWTGIWMGHAILDRVSRKID